MHIHPHHHGDRHPPHHRHRDAFADFDAPVDVFVDDNLAPDERFGKAERDHRCGGRHGNRERLMAPRGPFGGPSGHGDRGPHDHGPFGRPGRPGRGGRFFENGMLRLVILALVAEAPRHGYEVIKEIEERTGGAYSPSPGVVYPTLTLLEETGEIEAAASEGNKRLYSITDKGRQTVEDNRAAIDAVLKRFADATRAPNRNPRLIRAIENLRLSLRLKGEAGELDAERMSRLIDLLDATARQIDEI